MPALAPAPTEVSAPSLDGGLSALEIEVIELVVGGLRLLGFPRSLGEIYGLLFMAREPVTFDSIVQRLQMSKGSASQGLKTLRQIGAIKVSYVPGDRRDYYLAETELKKLIAGFFAGQLIPHLDDGRERLDQVRDRLDALVSDADADLVEFYDQRLAKLAQWQRHAKACAPLVSKLLDSSDQ
jgi:HTH-type transcriptional regulator, glycine betaine synthesis regulator